MVELFDKWLTVDPGEDTGWSLWEQDSLVDSGTEKMWVFGDAVWQAAFRQFVKDGTFAGEYLTEFDEPLADLFEGIQAIVCENFTIYPWVAAEGGLDWDEVRTARLIGSLYQCARLANWEWVQQGAKIKERAVAAGAESFFSKPLRENRHANDAIQHGVYYAARCRNEPWTDLDSKDFIVDA